MPPAEAPTPKPVPTRIHELSLTRVAAPFAADAARSTGSTRSTRSTDSGSGSAPAILTAQTTSASFQTVGVSWSGRSDGDNLLISVRTHDAHGWSAWQDLSDDAGVDPTASAAARGGTDPLWVGPSDGVQARIGLTSGALPKDMKLELVDPGSSPYDATAAATAPGATANLVVDPTSIRTDSIPADSIQADAVRAGAQAGVAEPAVLSRAQWGADESKVRAAPTYMPTIKAFVMHHTAGPNNYSAAQVPAIIRGDYAYHLSRGWNDIGYNALVDRFGRIWEGRAGGLSRNVMGAHAGGFNDDTFGVAVIGNFDTARPSAAAVTGVARIMAWKLDLNHRDPMGTTKLTSAGGGTARWKAGVTRTFNVIMGHRDTGFTDCPGRYLYPFLASIRSQVKAIMKAAVLNPAAPATAATGTPVSLTAHALAAQSWTLSVTRSAAQSCATAATVATVTGQAAAGGAITATWNGLAGGVAARPGAYTLTLSSQSSTATARPVSFTTTVLPPAPVAMPTGALSAGAGGYVPVRPTRVLDTRAAGRLPIGPAGRIDVPVLGQGGIPATGVSAVVLNLTTGCPTGTTSLTVYPTGTPSTRAVTSVPKGVTRSVLVTTRVGADGEISIGNASGVSELTADVVGYYAVAGGSPVLPVANTRIYDSAQDTAGPVPVGAARAVPLPATIGGVPASEVSAVMVDVSALTPAAAGSLAAYDPAQPAAALPTLAFRKGESVDNLAIVPVSGGVLDLQATGTPVHAVLDVRALVLNVPLGTAGSTEFTPTAPVQVADTGTSGGAVAHGAPRTVVVTGPGTGAPITATAVLIGLTAVDPGQDTWLQAYPYGAAPTGGTGLRAPAGDSRGNLIVVPVGRGGAIAVANAAGSTQMRVDVRGWFR